MKSIYYPITWEYIATIPFQDIAEYLSIEDYEKYSDNYLSVDITLYYDYTREDKEVGQSEYITYCNWNSSVEYPESIQNAITAYLSKEGYRYDDDAYEKLCDFIDYQKYGDY